MVRPPYSAVQRLIAIAIQHWAAIDGEAAARGADYFGLSFDRFLNSIYWWAVQRVRDAEVWAAGLDQPLDGAGGLVVTEAELEADAASFMAFASAFGITPPRASAVLAGDAPVPSEPSG